MFDATHIYGLDIETDNSQGFGLDPRRGAITEIALATDPSVLDGGVVLSGSEDSIFNGLYELLRSLPSGLIATWNGAFFDLPFIADRARGHALSYVIELTPQRGLEPKYDFLPGHDTGYSATFHVGPRIHSHLDVSFGYRLFAENSEPPVSWSLKPVCKSLGIDMVELDRANLEKYTEEERRAYCMSDSVGTRELAIRLLGADA